MNDKRISLRPARLADLAWLDPFYESLMRPYVELTHEWDMTIFRMSFNPKESSIIQFDGQDIGLFTVKEREDGLYLGDIQVKPEYQGRGIGLFLIKGVLTDEIRKGRDVRLRVLKGNPAIKLYRRVGFEVEQELDNCYEMVYSASCESK